MQNQKNTDYQPLTTLPLCNNRQKTGKTRNEKQTKYDHKTPAYRYKNAQPLMVPFYAEEESTEAKL